MDIQKYFKDKKEIVDSALRRYFLNQPESTREGVFPTSLYKAIQYSLFAGGKRIRPILSMAAFEAVGGKGDGILPFSCALEMIHTYSLIHDDLPAMDNDDYRRGRPTCHKVFGEAVGILAGDALLTEAFELMTNQAIQEVSKRHADLILNVVHEVAQAAGMFGMVGGQVLDIESEGKDVDFPTLQYIHIHKTGALILVSVRVGARLGGASEEALKALTHYGEGVGLAFQIADDILNIEGKASQLGKKIGSDLDRRKATYPSLLGMEASKRRAKELIEMSENAIRSFGAEAEPLREIARFVLSREY
jgi:geranylgeranyl diphosphate synthase type II